MTEQAKQDFFVVLGKRISQLRKAHSWSQTEIGKKIGSSQQMIAVAIGHPAPELLDYTGGGSRKHVPSPKLQQQFEQLKYLPRSKQQYVIRILHNALIGSNS